MSVSLALLLRGVGSCSSAATVPLLARYAPGPVGASSWRTCLRRRAAASSSDSSCSSGIRPDYGELSDHREQGGRNQPTHRFSPQLRKFDRDSLGCAPRLAFDAPILADTLALGAGRVVRAGGAPGNRRGQQGVDGLDEQPSPTVDGSSEVQALTMPDRRVVAMALRPGKALMPPPPHKGTLRQPISSPSLSLQPPSTPHTLTSSTEIVKDGGFDLRGVFLAAFDEEIRLIQAENAVARARGVETAAPAASDFAIDGNDAVSGSKLGVIDEKDNCLLGGHHSGSLSALKTSPDAWGEIKHRLIGSWEDIHPSSGKLRIHQVEMSEDGNLIGRSRTLATRRDPNATVVGPVPIWPAQDNAKLSIRWGAQGKVELDTSSLSLDPCISIIWKSIDHEEKRWEWTRRILGPLVTSNLSLSGSTPVAPRLVEGSTTMKSQTKRAPKWRVGVDRTEALKQVAHAIIHAFASFDWDRRQLALPAKVLVTARELADLGDIVSTAATLSSHEITAANWAKVNMAREDFMKGGMSLQAASAAALPKGSEFPSAAGRRLLMRIERLSPQAKGAIEDAALVKFSSGARVMWPVWRRLLLPASSERRPSSEGVDEV